MKKISTALLAAVLLLSTLMPMTFAADAAWTQNTDISSADFKIGVIGDSHVTASEEMLGWFQEALSAQETLGGSLNTLALTGDVIYQNKSDELINDRYDSVMNTLTTKGYGLDEGETPFVYAVGNHEFPQNGNSSAEMIQAAKDLFTEKTGQALNVHREIGGYHFIAAAPESYNLNYSTETETWLKQEIDSAITAGGTDKPVFVMLHGPISGTFFGKENSRFTADFLAYLKTKPQVINLTAHEHVAAQLPQNIWQDGFTVFETPLTGGGYLEEIGCTSTGNISSVHQASMITVTNNIVKIYKLDLVAKQLIGEPWVVDVPQLAAGQNDAYLYSADKRENASVPSFPKEAAVTATVSGSLVSVTWPNTAENVGTPNQQDDFVRAYKLVFTTKSGAIISEATYQNDFYKATPSASFTKTIGGLLSGATVVVKVYPMSPFGGFGEPISTEVTTEAEVIPAKAVRYEFEDYVPSDGTAYPMIKTSEFASGGKLLSSNQGGGFVPIDTIARDAADPTFSFEIDIAAEGDYTPTYALGWLDSTFVSKLTLKIDNTEIGTNSKTGWDRDLSLNGTYPWSFIRLKHYTAENIHLTAGKHKVTLQIDKTVTEKNTDGLPQPYLFCADYFQLEPVASTIFTDEDFYVEFENNASAFSVAPTVKTSANAHNGGYIHFDTNSRTEPVTFSLPITVLEAGLYDFEYVATASYSVTELYLDDAETPFYTTSGAQSTKLDTAQVGGVWPYFGEKYHQASKFEFTATLPAGSHTINGKLLLRPADVYDNVQSYDVCICMDYLKIAVVGAGNANELSAKQTTRIELENYAKTFSIPQTNGTNWQPYAGESSGCSNGQYLFIDSENTDSAHASNNYETFSVPITVLQDGYYNMQYVEANKVSALDIFLDNEDGTPLSSGFASTLDETKNNEGKKQYFNSSWATAKISSGKVYLSAGKHNLLFRLTQREEKDFAAYLDYVEFQPITFNLTDDTATAMVSFDKAVTGKVILALYNGQQFIGMNSVDVTDQTVATVTAITDKTVTKAKVFVWDNFTNCIPQTEFKTVYDSAQTAQ